jgi:hypothetical protein
MRVIVIRIVPRSGVAQLIRMCDSRQKNASASARRPGGKNKKGLLIAAPVLVKRTELRAVPWRFHGVGSDCAT